MIKTTTFTTDVTISIDELVRLETDDASSCGYETVVTIYFQGFYITDRLFLSDSHLNGIGVNSIYPMGTFSKISKELIELIVQLIGEEILEKK